MKRILSFIAVLCFGMSWAKAQDTDVSTLDNTIYIENFSAKAGDEVTLSVKMKNTIAPTGFQFDLVLPDGLTVNVDDEGFYCIELSTARTTTKKTDTFSCAKCNDGSIRVLCSSTKSYTFSGNDGEVAIITLTVSNDMADGSYPIELKNVELSEADGTAHRLSGTVNSTITVTSASTALKGDVNEDGRVDIQDVAALIKIILSQSK